ncbi:MAG: glycosyltransferase family 39 protein, partial [Bacteroidota bacterium]
MKAKHFVWGSLLLLVVFLFVGHQAILHEPPQSIHKWRQSDSASWAWNYYHGSANLFKPQFNNLANEQKAASEFPIVYWLVGMFYRLFSPHHAWFRGLQLLIVFSGFWALYRWAILVLTDQTWSILYALLIASSPLLHFYANGFIPDPLAFAACAWGWYGFFRYRATPQTHVLILSLLSFGLAALFKVSFIGSLG